MEIRAFQNMKSDGRRVFGHAAPFNSPADIGGFFEVIKPGAFSQSLKAGKNIRALAFHDDKALLGTTKAGTLKLWEDDLGLAFELDLPNTSHGNDIAELVGRGDISGCSFGFNVIDEAWKGDTRELISVDLVEVTLTPNPAYIATNVSLRDKQGFKKSLDRLWVETVR